ncbi:hypothetical protein EAO69_07005 [Streptomyces sp. me109]|nr:hypothetical protein EAO69_07005 [Streptomyces sp. me109]
MESRRRRASRSRSPGSSRACRRRVRAGSGASARWDRSRPARWPSVRPPARPRGRPGSRTPEPSARTGGRPAVRGPRRHPGPRRLGRVCASAWRHFSRVVMSTLFTHP